MNTAALHASESRGHVINAALVVLADGRSWSAANIARDASRRGLLPPGFNPKYVYTALIEYIARANGNGRRPRIVQDARRGFRLNEPLDDWPDVVTFAARPVDLTAEALIARLEATSRSGSPLTFEQTVCAVFAKIGFIATHVGGFKAPDGYADAPLGRLSYRVMLECKTASSDVLQPDALEATKYRESFGAQYCTLIGPAFSEEVSLVKELQLHAVSAWTVADLRTVLREGCNTHELSAVFAPGFAADGLADLLWERRHGRAKRIATIAHFIQQRGWQLQATAAAQRAATESPVMTVDVAMALVDEALASAASARACARDEVQLAFARLTDPVAPVAVWLDEEQSAIVITRDLRN